MSDKTFWNGTEITDEPVRIVAETLEQMENALESWPEQADYLIDQLQAAGWCIYRKELVDRADAAWTLQQIRNGQARVVAGRSPIVGRDMTDET